MNSVLAVLRSFPHALRGVGAALRTEQNLRVHLLATVLALGIAVWLRLPLNELALLVLVCALVVALELVNTAVEAVVDLASPQFHPLAKTAKDVAAGAVLVAAFAAVLIGALLLGPPLLQFYFH